ncbi:MAG: galactose mutarotase [Terracidiphilus sp.]|nr:galactose mutarotase [Terracidiphilus sp.]MDR3776115.1 galactose mutarotase [Terracidiphilus sp.]
MHAATVTHAPWGKDASSTPVELYTMTLGKAEVAVTTYGARIVSVRVPNKNGGVANVIVGRDSVQGYMDPAASARGATIGRYANRIAGGKFTLDGNQYQIPINRGGNALHGGTIGFDRKVWQAREVKDGVEMTLVSPDGDMGFPGKLTVHVRFTLTQRQGSPVLNIEYAAESDKATVINFTNHAYFNLADDSNESVMDDLAIINANSYTPVDASGIPLGSVDPVAGTPLDFRTRRAIGDGIPERGYDHNFVLRSPGLKSPAAEVQDLKSGRAIQVFTTEPGLQFFMPRVSPPVSDSHSSLTHPLSNAFCLETQHFPDAPNHPQFPSTVLRPGKPYRSTTIYVFGVQD